MSCGRALAPKGATAMPSQAVTATAMDSRVFVIRDLGLVSVTVSPFVGAKSCSKHGSGGTSVRDCCRATRMAATPSAEACPVGSSGQRIAADALGARRRVGQGGSVPGAAPTEGGSRSRRYARDRLTGEDMASCVQPLLASAAPKGPLRQPRALPLVLSADFRAARSALLVGVFEVEAAAAPPGDDGVGEVGAAQDG
jgi:hypothetical protein